MKAPLILSISCLIICRLLKTYTDMGNLAYLIFIIPIVLICIGLILRKRIQYRNWFLNSVIFEKQEIKFTSDISSNLLFDKILENLKNHDFVKFFGQDKSDLILLGGTKPNTLTWGENIYVQLGKTNYGTEVKVTSVNLFGSTSWGRNKSNTKSFLESFEESLTI